VTVVKVFLGALGAVAIGIGVILVAVAVGLLTWVGTNDTVVLPEIYMATEDGTILARDIEFLFEDARFVPELGSASLRVRSISGEPVFVGVTDHLTASRFLGDGISAPDQSFWLVSDQGVVADLAWDMKPGNWTFVVVAEDGSSPTEIAIEGELGAAPFRFAAGTVATLGLGAGVAGGLLLLVAVAAGRTRTVKAPTPRRKVPAPI
jgi:hypothetical protein